MAAKNCLVIGFLNEGEAFVIQPTKNGETRFSKKEAQQIATAHVQQKTAVRALVVEEVQVVNP